MTETWCIVDVRLEILPGRLTLQVLTETVIGWKYLITGCYSHLPLSCWFWSHWVIGQCSTAHLLSCEIKFSAVENSPTLCESRKISSLSKGKLMNSKHCGELYSQWTGLKWDNWPRGQTDWQNVWPSSQSYRHQTQTQTVLRKCLHYNLSDQTRRLCNV